MTADVTERWVGIRALEDPRLGIEDRQLAELGWAVFSRLFGKMSGWRANSDRYSRLIAGIATVALTGRNELPPLCPELRPLGWPDGKQLLRRRRLEPNDLDSAWKRSIKVEGEECLARLDLELVTALIQPELVRAFLLMVEEGSQLTGKRFERWMRLVAAGEAACGSALGISSLEHMQTNFRTLFGHLQWLLRSEPKFMDLVERWRELPPQLDIDDLDPSRRMRQTSATPRSAARRAFFTLKATLAERENKRTWDRHLNQLKPRRNLALLGTLAAHAPRIETVAGMTVAPQFREDGTYRSGGYIREYECPWDHEKRPALLFANLKGKRDKFAVKVITRELAQIYDGYLDYVGIADQPSHPMWVSEWEAFDSHTGEKISRQEYQYLYKDNRYIVRPRALGGMHPEEGIRFIMETVLGDLTERDNPHASRKLAYQLAPEAARIHVAEGGTELGGLLEGFTAAEILLDHGLPELVGIYGDLADVNSERRQEVSWIVGCLNYELLFGDRGATFGLDVESVCAARDYLAQADLMLTAVRQRAEELTTEIKQLHAESHHAQRRFVELRQGLRDMRAAALEHAAENLSESEFRRIVILGQECDDEQNEALRLERSLVEKRDSERSEVIRMTNVVAEARAELNAAIARRIPLPEPVEEEPDIEGQLEDLLGDTQKAIGSEPDAALVRDVLTLPEYADAMKIKFATLRLHVWQAQKAGTVTRFTEGDERNTWFQPLNEIMVSEGNWRFVKWSALDKSRYTPAQLAAFRIALSRPISEAKWVRAEEAVASRGDAPSQ